MAAIGVMVAFGASDPEAKPFVAALKKGLQGLGSIEGRNIEFDFRWPAADPDRIRAYATELVDTKPSVILATSLSNCSHLAPIVVSKFVKPVILPPGAARLAANPLRIGSAILTNTTGTVRVSRWRAAVAVVLLTRITLGFVSTSSVA